MSKRILATLAIAMLMVSSLVNADSLRGRSIYNSHCAGCHGGDGRGVMAGTPSFAGSAGTLAKPDFELKITIEQGKGIMPGFQSVLKADQIYDVIAHIRTFF